MEKDKLNELDIATFHAMLQSGETTCLELVDHYLARIEKYDEQLNAVICLNPNIRQEAREKDEIFKAKGLQGALFGVPLLIKDCINTADMPTTSGSKALENLRPQEDAWVVKQLRAAGAMILAKVNLSELACTGESKGSLIGQTHNPYDISYTPGGSSGGTGVGLSANYGLAGLGTDTMNSIRSPASACSIVGVRGSRGLIGRSGVLPYAFTHDSVGPLARSVKDAAAMLDVLCGFDETDRVTAWSVGRCGGYLAGLSAGGLKGWRIGVVRSLMGNKPANKEVTALMEAAFADLTALGAQVEDFSYHVDMDELQRDVNVQFHEQPGDMSSYLEKFADQTGYKTLREVVDSGKVEPWVAAKLSKALDTTAQTGQDEEYKRRLLNIPVLQEKILYAMAKQRLDALVYPMQQQLVAKIGDQQAERNGLFCSSTGFPAVIVPAGFSAPTATAPFGIPVGIEFVGRPFTEKLLLQLAFTYEQATRHRRPPVL